MPYQWSESDVQFIHLIPRYLRRQVSELPSEMRCVYPHDVLVATVEFVKHLDKKCRIITDIKPGSPVTVISVQDSREVDFPVRVRWTDTQPNEWNVYAQAPREADIWYGVADRMKWMTLLLERYDALKKARANVGEAIAKSMQEGDDESR